MILHSNDQSNYWYYLFVFQLTPGPIDPTKILSVWRSRLEHMPSTAFPCHNKRRNGTAIWINFWIRWNPQYLFLVAQGEKLGGDSEETENRGPLPQQVWHDKNPSLLKRFAGNGDISIWMQYVYVRSQPILSIFWCRVVIRFSHNLWMWYRTSGF